MEIYNMPQGNNEMPSQSQPQQYPNYKPPKKKAGKIVLIIIVAFIALCAIAAVVGGNLADDAAKIASETTNEKADAASDATAEKESDSASGTEKATEDTTETPTESTKESDASTNNDPAALEYQITVLNLASEIGEALLDIGDQSSLAGSDPTLLLDQDWIIKTAADIAVINNGSDSILDYDTDTVPNEWLPFHKEWRKVAKYLKKMTAAYTEGIDEFDMDKIDKSSEYMNTASTHINKANELMPL
jgi:cytoskeletal protein RodZ